MNIKCTVEELMLDESFLDYCRNKNSVYKNKWEQIIAQYPDQLKIMEEGKKLLFLLDPQLPQEEVDVEVNKIRKIIIDEKKGRLTGTTDDCKMHEELYVSKWGKLNNKKFRKVLASCVVMICLLSAALYVVNTGWKDKLKENKIMAGTQYQSPIGERKQVELPDGSLVILNSNSSVSITSAFNQKDRVVQLSGDAFFKVSKNAGKPFIVINKKISTTALGTSFYVHARNDKENYSVDLLEGKVKLAATNATDKMAYLSAGEKGEWQQGKSIFIKNSFDTLLLKQWLSGKISFNKTPAKEAIQILEKWYAVNIEIKKKDIGKQTISGDYDNVSLDDILQVVCFTLSCKYTRIKDTVIIQ